MAAGSAVGSHGLRLRLLRRGLLGLVALATLGWTGVLTVHIVETRHDLLAAQSAAVSLHQDLGRADVTGSLAEVARLQKAADAASHDSQGQVWSWSAHLPLLGTQLNGVRTLSVAFSHLTDRALAPASVALDGLQEHPPVDNGTVDLPALISLRGVLGNTLTQLAFTRTQVQASSHAHHQLPQLRRAEASVVSQIGQLDSELTPLQRSLTLAPAMLGFNGGRTYLLAVQNPAEARGTGGLIAAYSLVSADHGKLTVVRSGTNLDFPQPLSPAHIYEGLEHGGTAETAAIDTFFGSNALPDWSRSGRTLAELSAAQFHTRIDGVIGLTPQAMARMLTVTGPVATSTGQVIDGRNVADFVQVGEYRDITSTAVRKAAVGDLARVMVTTLVHGRLGLQQLRHALAGSLGTGDITFYSTHPSEQAVIAQTSIAGTLPVSPSFIQVVDDNTGGGKMDAYLHRRVTVARVIGTSDITVTATFTNAVKDPETLTNYQASRLDAGGTSAPRGAGRDLISLYAGTGATVGEVTVDGAAASPLRETDEGHPRVSVDLRLDPGRSATITWTVHDAPGLIDYRVQPLAVPEQAIIRN